MGVLSFAVREVDLIAAVVSKFHCRTLPSPGEALLDFDLVALNEVMMNF